MRSHSQRGSRDLSPGLLDSLHSLASHTLIYQEERDWEWHWPGLWDHLPLPGPQFPHP